MGEKFDGLQKAATGDAEALSAGGWENQGDAKSHLEWAQDRAARKSTLGTADAAAMGASVPPYGSVDIMHNLEEIYSDPAAWKQAKADKSKGGGFLGFGKKG